MKYLIDLSQRQAQKIQNYLDEGKYLSISQFVITAIENQFNLEDNQFPLEMAGENESPKMPHSTSNPLHLTTVLEAYKISDMQNFYAAILPPCKLPFF